MPNEMNILLATWFEESTHWKRCWWWERLKAGGESDDRGWDGWMASPAQWTWVWVNSGSWWWARRPGMLQSMESLRVRDDWVTELNLTVHIVGARQLFLNKQIYMYITVHNVLKIQIRTFRISIVWFFSCTSSFCLHRDGNWSWVIMTYLLGRSFLIIVVLHS